MQANYWKTLSERVRAGDAQASRAMPAEMEPYLRIIVRRALRRPDSSTPLARAARAMARQLSADSDLPECSAGLVERVAHALAREVRDRIAFSPADAAACETLLAG